MRIDYEIKLDFQDVLIVPKRSTLSSRGEVNVQREFKAKHTGKVWSGVPILASNMDTVGSIRMGETLEKVGMGVCLHKFHEEGLMVQLYKGLVQSQRKNYFYSMGITPHDYDKFLRIQEQTERAIEFVCLDVANGYQENFVKFLTKLRTQHPELVIMAGNVVTFEMTQHLILAGADIVKVGIGSGSACLTRKVAGVGFPQLSAIMDCQDAAHGLDAQICSDGGCTCPGDVAKAFAAGSDFVMLGGMLAGYDECDGELIEKEGGCFLKFHGMSSKEAQELHYGGLQSHRAPEGKEVLIPCLGPVAERLLEVIGGVRSACSYVGARRLKDMSKCSSFIRVNRQLNDVFG